MYKSERLLQIIELLHDHPEGLSRAEIAKRMGVHRSTIGRDLISLENSFALIEDEDGLISIDRKSFLSELRLSMFELEALHIAAKLFQKVMNFPFPHAASAMRKLADAQGKVSRALADRMRETAELIDQTSPLLTINYSGYRNVIEQLGIAISEYRPVTIIHYSQNRNENSRYELLPLTLEPHPEGKAIHLIGWMFKETEPSFRTLKIERIQEVHLEAPARELYLRVPMEKFWGRLAAAWSIWSSEKTPQKVVLRFDPAIAARVRETTWHISQKLTEHADGSLMWQGIIAEPREMYPWIRGWGPDVEVLGPEWLRERHREDFLRGAKIYEK
ncbi:helix-turn-helix transcriptional regulator [Spirochaeta lutea]|uniref:DeoR faimly transcriptional regulator n=1 Tax=Spirochaeta lutea TaxID=1480694 RepID=A0A098QWB2_9SPIO|nr:WYL domain-containing protein [Spirochaeta lutea]KGE72160.1 DeoR faimly transcriptional regulator [Spirochaeta lutea]